MQTESVLEKGTAGINEDCQIIQENIFGVFDGATSLTGKTFPQGKTGGQMAAQTAGSVFSQNHYPLTRLARQANQQIRSRMIRHKVNVSEKENLWSTSAAVVRVTETGLEWVQTGDSVILLIYRDGSHKVLADPEDHDYETLTMWKDLVEDRLQKPPIACDSVSGEDINAIKQALAPQVKKVRQGMNIHYGVLNGEPGAEAFLNQGTEPLDNVTDILLFTDGLSMPREIPEKQKDYASLVNVYQSLGLEGVKDMIREKEKTDPFCLAFPRFKCHDDIAAIAVKI